MLLDPIHSVIAFLLLLILLAILWRDVTAKIVPFLGTFALLALIAYVAIRGQSLYIANH